MQRSERYRQAKLATRSQLLARQAQQEMLNGAAAKSGGAEAAVSLDDTDGKGWGDWAEGDEEVSAADLKRMERQNVELQHKLESDLDDVRSVRDRHPRVAPATTPSPGARMGGTVGGNMGGRGGPLGVWGRRASRWVGVGSITGGAG